MTVYDIPNIDKCTVEELGNPVVGYRIRANDDYCIHTANHADNVFARIIIIGINYNMSTIQILPIADLPADAEIHGEVKEPDHEAM